ncbi:hypothetical protein Dimus_001061 [Dionaea muscipula]
MVTTHRRLPNPPTPTAQPLSPTTLPLSLAHPLQPSSTDLQFESEGDERAKVELCPATMEIEKIREMEELKLGFGKTIATLWWSAMVAAAVVVGYGSSWVCRRWCRWCSSAMAALGISHGCGKGSAMEPNFVGFTKRITICDDYNSANYG